MSARLTLSPLARYLLAAVAVLLFEVAALRYTNGNPAIPGLVAGYVFPLVMGLLWVVVAAEAWSAEASTAAGEPAVPADWRRGVGELLRVALAAAGLTVLAVLASPGAAGSGTPVPPGRIWLYFALFGAITVAVAPVVGRLRRR